MSKFAVLVLSVALLGAAVQAWHYPEYNGKCYDYGASDVSCTASTSLHLTVRGPGKCEASANSFCAALTKKTRDCLDSRSLVLDQGCRDVDVNLDAKCWASAVAVAITKTSSSVLCDGRYAYGCSEAEAKASALACSVAQAILDLNVKIGYNQAECDAKISVMISAIAKATAESQSAACSKYNVPGFDKDFDLAGAIHKVVAEAFVSCWAYCDGYGNADASLSGGANAEDEFQKDFAFGDGAHSGTGYSYLP